ncbi:unnamed protein product [Dimorphilus gyrociliatus]|uniref:Bcl-2 Bcl-2 homology region 1-3 domain-containing protein n=1 Tax=Dimorphilus gyrociliatus TaxID=2664684 RepID=A0A7I8VNM9_9ANNE|nr:unnamed protein product [Dimorphilus gyrociliatus]
MTARRLVTDYVIYRLEREHLDFPGPNTKQYNNEYDKLREPIRALCKEFEERYIAAFENMVDQIHIADDNAKDSFTSVINELFSDGVRWGRIVGLFAFTGAICVQCVQKEMPYKVEQVIDWTTTYLETELKPWMDENEGWVS